MKKYTKTNEDNERFSGFIVQIIQDSLNIIDKQHTVTTRSHVLINVPSLKVVYGYRSLKQHQQQLMVVKVKMHNYNMSHRLRRQCISQIKTNLKLKENKMEKFI